MLTMTFRGKHGSFAYQTMYSAGADLCAQEPQKDHEAFRTLTFPEGKKKVWVLEAGKTLVIPTGVFIIDYQRPPSYEYEFLSVVPRSGLAAKNSVACFTGTIDADYREEIGVIIHNFSSKTFIIELGMRIAQLIAMKSQNVPSIERLLVDRLSGFGSTGVQG